jgi:hypothetical protein
MSLESDLVARLTSTFSGRVYPAEAPFGADTPYCVYVQRGGDAITFLESAKPSKKNAVVELTVWSTTYLDATAKMRAVEDSLITSTTLRALPQGALWATYDAETKLYGTLQEFSIWFTD